MSGPTDPAGDPEPPARGSTSKVLGGALVAVPLIVAGLGALVGAGLNCNGGNGSPMALFPVVAVGLALWWAFLCSARVWLIALSALGGGLLGSLAGLLSFLIVGFSRCYSF